MNINRHMQMLAERGTATKIANGLKTDQLTLSFIRNNPGSSIYDVKVGLNWSIGKVQGSIRRLENQGKISLNKVLRDGRVSQFIHVSEHATPPLGTIKIDKKLIDKINNWKDEVLVYALNITTMVITPTGTKELDKNSLYCWKVSCGSNEEGFVINLPTKAINFYKLQDGKIDVLSDGNVVFVDINHAFEGTSQKDSQSVDLPTSHRILILEDDKKYARTLRSSLNKYFDSIDLVFTEGEVRKKLIEKEYDYVILDWDISNIKAGERIFEWANKKGYKSPATIITSQDYTEEDEARFENLGFTSFLDKTTPNFSRILAKRILNALESRAKD